MIVAVDTLFLLKRFRYTGTGVYLSHLLSECLKIAEASTSRLEFHGFAPPHEPWAGNGFVSPFLRVHRAPVLAWRRLWLLGGMAIHTSHVRPDVVFIPTAHHSLPGRRAPVVTTVHDAMPKQLPPDLLRHATPLRVMTWLHAKLASKIITVSSWSKKSLIDIYRLRPEKVEVVYNGYDEQLYNQVPPDPAASAALLARLGIRRPFALHHGMVQIRKNIHRLVQAWDLLRQRNKSFDAQLVLAGPPGLGHEHILEVWQASPSRNQVIFTGPLPDSELAALVKLASLCVVPSLYEGFCLPMVEAMACGVPTVVSNSSSMPEVSGGVLEYFDPYSVEQMAETMRRTLEDTSLRDRLRHAGLARAAEFSWERCARETLRIFAEAAATHGQ